MLHAPCNTLESEGRSGSSHRWWSPLGCNQGTRKPQDPVKTFVSPAEIYAHCWEKKQIDYILRLREVRVEPCGRPAFVAANPETLKNANPEIHDRVQKGARELLPQNARVKTVM